jgi:hypothetical protein
MGSPLDSSAGSAPRGRLEIIVYQHYKPIHKNDTTSGSLFMIAPLAN